jgi:hypothetical protein
MEVLSASPPGRPPKPVPFGTTAAAAASLIEFVKPDDVPHGDAKINSKTRSIASNSEQQPQSSETSRHSLKLDVDRRRASLSLLEATFLEDLIVSGNDLHIEKARERLCNEDLFPEFHYTEINNDSIEYGGERSKALGVSDSRFFGEIEESMTRSRSLNFDTTQSTMKQQLLIGSERRQQLLAELRSSKCTTTLLWKSHKSGLSLSVNASRRSIVRRQHSYTFSAGSSSNSIIRQKKVVNQRNDDIFRTRRLSGSTVAGRRRSSMNSSSNGENRRRNDSETPVRMRRASFRRSKSISVCAAPLESLKQEKRVSMSGTAPSKQALLSFHSDITRRKSVTFGALPAPRLSEEDESDDFFKLISTPDSGRDVSGLSFADSIPSLHHASSVYSRRDSAGSIPSLHHPSSVYSTHDRSELLQHGHPVFSESFQSNMDLGQGPSWDPMMDETEATDEEKKMDIPANVEITEESTRNALKLEPFMRPLLLNESMDDEGQGFEVSDWETGALQGKECALLGGYHTSLAAARRLESLISFGDEISVYSTATSFDETMSFGRSTSGIFRKPIIRSLSDDDLTRIVIGSTRNDLPDASSLKDIHPIDDDVSWIESEADYKEYDPWKIIEDEYDNGFGGGGMLAFSILGTGPDDVDSQPHVMSPPLMDSLREFLPLSNMDDNFWMKYSLVRDGGSMITFLQAARGAKHSFLAIETVDGEVFGAFTSEPWRKNWNYFGNNETFLWRLQHSRREKCKSIIDQAQMESDIEVFPFTGRNEHIQLCTHDKIAVGGRSSVEAGDAKSPISHVKEHEWGFGLLIEKDLLHGTSSPCLTFCSPSLSKLHSDGSRFEIMNMEMWTITPCRSLKAAEKLEMSKLFLEEHFNY